MHGNQIPCIEPGYPAEVDAHPNLEYVGDNLYGPSVNSILHAVPDDLVLPEGHVLFLDAELDGGGLCVATQQLELCGAPPGVLAASSHQLGTTLAEL